MSDRRAPDSRSTSVAGAAPGASGPVDERRADPAAHDEAGGRRLEHGASEHGASEHEASEHGPVLQGARETPARADPAGTAVKAQLSPGTFDQLDLRVARVVEVLPFPAARRPAWRMVLDGGPVLGRLQTSAQLTRYEPEELLGRLVVVAANLGPRRIAGWRSDVLVLAAVPGDGPRLLGVDGDVAPGTPVA